MTIDDLKKSILAYFDNHSSLHGGGAGASPEAIARALGLNLSATKTALIRLNESGELRYHRSIDTYSLNVADTDATATSTVARNQSVRIRRKPYTPFCTEGYKVNGNNVTIFLDRRNNARSVTFSAAQLQHILDGVQP